MSDLKLIRKSEALTIACPECLQFINSHEMLREPASYISNVLECRKCKLQINMMGDKIATIWKIV
jgi:hypothetical protein